MQALGVVIELTSCVFSNVGLIFERNALLKEEARLGNTDDVKSYNPLSAYVPAARCGFRW